MSFSWSTLFGIGINDISNPFDKQRAQLEQQGYLNNIGTLTGLANEFSSNLNKISYAEAMESAAAQRASNVRTIQQAQAQSLLQAADVEANQIEINAAKLEVQAINFQRAATKDYLNSFSDVSALQGQQVAAFASSGVALSGSALDVINSTRESSIDAVEGSFLENINKVNQQFNEVTSMNFQAAMTRFSAEEQARFVGLTTDQRLS